MKKIKSSGVSIILARRQTFATNGKGVMILCNTGIRSLITVLIHSSGHFEPCFTVPPALPGLPMASYATDKERKHAKTVF